MPPKSKPAPAPEYPDIVKLAQVVEGLTHQVKQLAMILDEVREDLVWAVRNDKFHAVGHSQHYVASYDKPKPPEREDDEEDTTNPPRSEPSHPIAKPKTTLFE